jgi:NAD-dependent deacetylase
MNEQAIEQAAKLLAKASYICVSSGAGMSAESGIETFRDKNGLWSKFNAEELATPEGFARDPVKVWAWYRLRRQRFGQVEPHAGHRLLAEWESRVDKFVVVTQNIDGLHHAAGSQNVIELHGRIDMVRCVHCDYTLQGLDDLGPEPHCPNCQKWLRPAVVWFHEMLPPGALEAAFQAAQECDVLLLIGTSGVVQPAASLGEVAKSYGAALIEVNPNQTALSSLANVCVRAGCRDALTEIDKAWRRVGS